MAVFSFDSIDVNAYENMCTGKVMLSSSNMYRVCNKNVYLMKGDNHKSSYLLGDRNFKYNTGKIVYAGKIDGIETFYSTGFNYYGVVYDNREWFSTNDAWSDLSINGVVEYNVKFEKNLLIDQSSSKFISFYNEIGEYRIRQFIGGKVDSVIRVFVVSPDDYDVSVESLKYGDKSVNGANLIQGQEDLVFEFGGGTHGFGTVASLVVNECTMNVPFANPLRITNDKLNKCLIANAKNNVDIKVYDGLGRYDTFKYSFKLVSSEVSITMKDSVSELVTTSRRIVINANAGAYNELDDNYSLYYWSKDSNDKLTYEAFMSNYEASEHKGTYASNKLAVVPD